MVLDPFVDDRGVAPTVELQAELAAAVRALMSDTQRVVFDAAGCMAGGFVWSASWRYGLTDAGYVVFSG